MPAHSLPIKHQPQQEEAGCLAACTQMTLAWLEITVSQTDLNRLFDLTPAGVSLSRLKRLEKSYGVQVKIQKEGHLDDLFQSLDQDIPPIIFIRTGQLSYWDEDTQHAVLLVGYDGSRCC